VIDAFHGEMDHTKNHKQCQRDLKPFQNNMSINSNNKIESGYAKTFRNPKVFLGLCDANSILYLSGIQLDARANPEHLACSKPFFTSITLPPRFHSSSEKLR
jgi:hypothetical protein